MPSDNRVVIHLIGGGIVQGSALESMPVNEMMAHLLDPESVLAFADDAETKLIPSRAVAVITIANE
jgi:hypothetical protein